MMIQSRLAQRMLDDLQLAGHSPGTQDRYLKTIRGLANHFRLSPDRITEDQLRQYLLFLKNERRLAAGTLKIAYYGIRFFYSRTVKRRWPTLEKLRVPKEHKLPAVMSIGEVRQLIAAVKTVHNRVFLQTLYSLGLRLEEGLHLQLGDIDKDRKLVHVHRGKGAKDRYVPLPDSTLKLLRDYWKTHRNPKWIFPSLGRTRQDGATALIPMIASGRRQCLKKTAETLGWKKQGLSLHTLRHSYATHLLEAGVNLRLIQKYLGHSSLQTTMVYLHLTTQGEEQALAAINRVMS
jgi:site-specific recombinase XerD